MRSALPGSDSLELFTKLLFLLKETQLILRITKNPSVNTLAQISMFRASETQLKNKNGINTCLKDCQELKFPFFMEAFLEAKPKVSDAVSGYCEGESEDDTEDDTEDLNCMEVSHEEEDMGPQYLTTAMGHMHVKTAEAIYFNGGKMTFGAKSRKYRFYSGYFSEKSSLVEYNDSKKCCEDVVQKGDTVVATIHGADSKSGSEINGNSTGSNVHKVKGEVRFISKNHNPMRYYCKNHHQPPVNVWLWRDGKPVRCVFS